MTEAKEWFQTRDEGAEVICMINGEENVASSMNEAVMLYQCDEQSARGV